MTTMENTADTRAIEREVSDARRKLESDIAELDARVRGERAAVRSRVEDNALPLAGGAAAVGLLLGLGGKGAVRTLLAFGIPAAAAYLLVKQQLKD